MVEEEHFSSPQLPFCPTKAQRKTRISIDKPKARARFRLEIAPKTIGTQTPSFMPKAAGRDMRNCILESRHVAYAECGAVLVAV